MTVDTERDGSTGGILAGLGRIKVKLGVVIVGSVATAFVVNEVGRALNMPAVARVVLATLLALSMVQMLSRGMTKPLRDMVAGARSIAKGRYDLRVDVESRDEVGELARAFNAMAADLAEVDRQRRDLVANVSHELRTPTAALRAVLENIIDGVSEPDPRTLDTALAQTERLGRLVAQLLDLSRLESGTRSIELETVELAELGDQAVREAALGRSEVSVHAEIPRELAVRADPDLLAQALANLLDNAVRHSPAGGTVTLAAEPHESGVRLTVTDQGPGIPATERIRVFERFSRLDTGRTVDQGGTGLGLAITKEIIELHNGTIQVTDHVADHTIDDKSGPGCQLTIELPGRILMSETSPARQAESAAKTPEEKPAKPDQAVPYVPPSVFPRPQLPEPPSWLLWRAGVVGLIAAIALPFSDPGIGVPLVVLVAGLAAAPALRQRVNPWSVTFGALSYALVSVAVFRDADWLVAPLLLAGFGLAALAIAGTGKHWVGIVKGGLSVPLAAFHVPWFVSGPLKRALGRGRIAPALAGAVLTVVLLLVFGSLFASADAVFSEYATRVWTTAAWLDSLPLRGFVFVVFAVLLAAAVLVALRPTAEPKPAQFDFRVGRAVWLIPLAALNLLFATFVGLQISVLFGGQRRVLETAGMTYAEYARSGFFQLVWISVFVLAIVAIVAGMLRFGRNDRWLVAGLLGLLCAWTLVVLASALHRLGLYVDVYGWSRLRAEVEATIWWLAAVFALVLIAGGIRLFRKGSANWLPRAVVALTGVGLLAFAAWNPDLRIAESSIEVRGADRIDQTYLSGLAAEAVPALDTLPEPVRSCVLREVVWQNDLDRADSWNGWNLARMRARQILEERPVSVDVSCER